MERIRTLPKEGRKDIDSPSQPIGRKILAGTLASLAQGIAIISLKKKRRVVNLYDMPAVREDWVDALLWKWVRSIIEYPEKMSVGLQGIQDEFLKDDQALVDRLAVIDDQYKVYQGQLEK
jgi:hypothetical protein